MRRRGSADLSSAYNGSFSILGGADGDALDTLATQSFSVTVTPFVAAAPEPGSLALTLGGFTGFSLLLARRRGHAA